MSAFSFHTYSAEETANLARKLAEKLQPGDVITLNGDLGAGKTTFTKGLARGMGIKRNVNSPTFTIIKEYAGRLPLFHMDVYRLDGEEDLGFDEYFDSEGVTVIEWAERIKDRLPEERLAVEIRLCSETERTITFKPNGDRYVLLCEELKNESTGH